jgi:hypothetical protein
MTKLQSILGLKGINWGAARLRGAGNCVGINACGAATGCAGQEGRRCR